MEKQKGDNKIEKDFDAINDERISRMLQLGL
jgi:hypothetical protein